MLSLNWKKKVCDKNILWSTVLEIQYFEDNTGLSILWSYLKVKTNWQKEPLQPRLKYKHETLKLPVTRTKHFKNITEQCPFMHMILLDEDKKLWTKLGINDTVL